MKITIPYTILSRYEIIWINGMDKLLLTPEWEKSQYFRIHLRKWNHISKIQGYYMIEQFETEFAHIFIAEKTDCS